MGLERPTYWHRLFGTRARLASMDEALQRIRIAATMGNPMDPEKAAVTMGDIDELARVALRAPAAPKAGYSREMSEALWGPYPAAPKEEA